MGDLKTKELFCRPADERALIAYCMKDLVSYYAVCARLDPEDFLYSQHEVLMLIFAALSGKNAASLEPTLIISEASAIGVLNDIGGPKYIQTMYSMDVKADNFELYLNSVVEANTKYRLHSLLEESSIEIESNSKEGLSSSDLLGAVEGSVMDLSMRGFNIDEPVNLNTGLDQYIEERREHKIQMSGLPTGYKILDRQIDGMTPGSLFVVAARKKKGKSTLLSNIAGHVAYIQRKPVLYVDTELTFEEWRPRMLASLSGVKERDIKHGGYSDIDYEKLVKSSNIVSKGRLFHEYMPGYSVEKLVALYKKYKYKEDIGLIVFDYLKEPNSTSLDRSRKEYQLLGDVTTKLKDLAGQLDIPALTAVQLNRDNDVADSDRIARYADVVAHWYERPPDELEEGGKYCGTHKLEIRDTRRGGATNRHGIGYNFHKEIMRIVEVASNKQYFTNFDKVVNNDSASEDMDYEDADLQ